MSEDKTNKGAFPVLKKLAIGILLTLGANAIFLTISFTVREYPVSAGELVLSKGILQVCQQWKFVTNRAYTAYHSL